MLIALSETGEYRPENLDPYLNFLKGGSYEKETRVSRDGDMGVLFGGPKCNAGMHGNLRFIYNKVQKILVSWIQ